MLMSHVVPLKGADQEWVILSTRCWYRPTLVRCLTICGLRLGLSVVILPTWVELISDSFVSFTLPANHLTIHHLTGHPKPPNTHLSQPPDHECVCVCVSVLPRTPSSTTTLEITFVLFKPMFFFLMKIDRLLLDTCKTNIFHTCHLLLLFKNQCFFNED